MDLDSELTCDEIKIKSRNIIDKFIKRFFDIFCSLLAIAILFPIFIIIAILIKLDGGPILYNQKRIGQNQKIFKMYKFRSMKVNSDDHFKSMSDEEATNYLNNKPQNDSRITKIGKFIRKFSIDELPQLFNILNGSMTLVGPRPMHLKEISQLNATQKNRFKVKQGLTCYRQISKKKNMTLSEKMQLDLKYVEKANIFIDAKLIIKTILFVLRGKNR